MTHRQKDLPHCGHAHSCMCAHDAVYMCARLYVFIHMLVCKHSCIVHMHACVFVCIVVCVHAYSYVFVNMVVCVYAYVCVFVCVVASVHTHACVCVLSCMCAQTCLYVCVNGCMCAQACLCVSLSLFFLTVYLQWAEFIHIWKTNGTRSAFVKTRVAVQGTPASERLYTSPCSGMLHTLCFSFQGHDFLPVFLS